MSNPAIGFTDIGNLFRQLSNELLKSSEKVLSYFDYPIRRGMYSP